MKQDHGGIWYPSGAVRSGKPLKGFQVSETHDGICDAERYCGRGVRTGESCKDNPGGMLSSSWLMEKHLYKRSSSENRNTQTNDEK